MLFDRKSTNKTIKKRAFHSFFVTFMHLARQLLRVFMHRIAIFKVYIWEFCGLKVTLLRKIITLKINNTIMKSMKLSVCALSAAMLLSSCGGMSNTAKGGLIGGTSAGALGALVGQLIGKGKGAAIGAAVGAAVGTGAGVLIGNKMDKAKKAAEAAKAKAEILQGTDGTQYVKATFDSGLLFNTSSASLSADAQAAINTFVKNLKAADADASYELAICGFTDNAGWKNSTAEQSKQKNLDLSQNRADAVKSQIVGAGYPSSRLVSVKGYGEENPVESNATAAGKQANRRVEVYILPSKDMIEAANKEAANK